MEIKVYDMLVFEDEEGGIYQDCVWGIQKRRFIGFGIECNKFYVSVLEDFSEIIGISARGTFSRKQNCYNGYREDFKLKEIWTRTDEDTYKKVWESK